MTWVLADVYTKCNSHTSMLDPIYNNVISFSMQDTNKMCLTVVTPWTQNQWTQKMLEG